MDINTPGQKEPIIPPLGGKAPEATPSPGPKLPDGVDSPTQEEKLSPVPKGGGALGQPPVAGPPEAPQVPSEVTPTGPADATPPIEPKQELPSPSDAGLPQPGQPPEVAAPGQGDASPPAPEIKPDVGAAGATNAETIDPTAHGTPTALEGAVGGSPSNEVAGGTPAGETDNLSVREKQRQQEEDLMTELADLLQERIRRVSGRLDKAREGLRNIREYGDNTDKEIAEIDRDINAMVEEYAKKRGYTSPETPESPAGEK